MRYALGSLVRTNITAASISRRASTFRTATSVRPNCNDGFCSFGAKDMETKNYRVTTRTMCIRAEGALSQQPSMEPPRRASIEPPCLMTLRVQPAHRYESSSDRAFGQGWAIRWMNVYHDGDDRDCRNRWGTLVAALLGKYPSSMSMTEVPPHWKGTEASHDSTGQLCCVRE